MKPDYNLPVISYCVFEKQHLYVSEIWYLKPKILSIQF